MINMGNGQKNPVISVLMSVYNCERFVALAVESILNQTFADFEFIIIDDGSTDGTAEILARYDDPRIRLISRGNKGLAVSLNEGLGLARGRFVARMDADDVADPDRLAKQAAHLDSYPEVAILGSWALAVDEQGRKVSEYAYPPASDKRIKAYAVLHNPFIHSTVMFRKAAILSVGGYDPAFKHIEDYELWTRVLSRYESANLPEFLLEYRLLSTGITGSHNFAMRLKGLKVRWLLLKRFLFR